MDLAALFVDFDAYFASAEQHMQPHLRGKPVGVAPILAETSCCVAASYEAKAHGIKTADHVAEGFGHISDFTVFLLEVNEFLFFTITA